MFYQKNHSLSIRALFSKIATSYDKTNIFMSGGMHFFWNRALVHSLQAQKNHTFLDICAGTGAITKCYLKQVAPTANVTLVDFCPSMLEVATSRLSRYKNISYLVADACALTLPDQSFDRIAMAYGLRNITQPELALSEAYRVLNENGIFTILELTQPTNRVLSYCHSLWLRYAIPFIGKVFSKDYQAYEYLQNSIHEFKRPNEVILLLKKSGFTTVVHQPLSGQIASLFIAYKQSPSSHEF